MYFLLADIPSYGVITSVLPGKSWNICSLYLVERIGVRTMLKILDVLSFGLIGASSPHRNHTGNCAQHAKMSWPLSLMVMSMMMRAGGENCRLLGGVMWAQGLLGCRFTLLPPTDLLYTLEHIVVFPSAGSKSEARLLVCCSGYPACRVEWRQQTLCAGTVCA